ncbi:Uncharacterised protein [uncultured Flavonifractor sp.]|nr:Uncharacterised protein [uncultured Flavonifractor sp.]
MAPVPEVMDTVRLPPSQSTWASMALASTRTGTSTRPYTACTPSAMYSARPLASR